MKTYNSNIENGLKSAFFKVQDLIHTEQILDDEVQAVFKQLDSLIVKAQNGEIDNIPK